MKPKKMYSLWFEMSTWIDYYNFAEYIKIWGEFHFPSHCTYYDCTPPLSMTSIKHEYKDFNFG
jgi:hypothetical protein